MIDQPEYASGGLFLQSIIDFAPPVVELIWEVINDGKTAEPPRVFTRAAGRHAAQLLLAGRATPEECRVWARFLLSRRDVFLGDGADALLLDFLEEWSFPDVLPEVDRSSAARWDVILR